jgi:hypothetical protein
MPAKRVRLRHKRIEPTPAWVGLFVNRGIVPPTGTPEHDQYIAWRYLGEPVSGLPEGGGSPACRALVAATRGA